MDLGLGLNMKCMLNIILTTTLLFTLTSCLKKQDLSSEDLGPAINPDELSKAVAKGFGPYDYNDIKPNERSSYTKTQTIQDTSSSPVEQQDITVNSVENTSDALNWDLTVALTSYAGGQSSLMVRNWNTPIQKRYAQLNSQQIDTQKAESLPRSFSTFESTGFMPTILFLQWPALVFGSCRDEGKLPETCHNLQVTEFQYRVPKNAAGQHNCTKPETCFVTAQKIEFDLIQKAVIDQDGKPRRTHFSMILSPEVPFFSRFLQLCTRSLYEVSGLSSKILADQCYTINDYAFGTATPAEIK